MEPGDRLPEEHLGTVGMIRQRADQLEQLADACVAESIEQEKSSRRLVQRASRLREQALEYRHAAHAVEKAGDDLDVGSLMPTRTVTMSDQDSPPQHPVHGDVWLQQDPVDPTTYRRLEYDADAANGPNPPGGWFRKAAGPGADV